MTPENNYLLAMRSDPSAPIPPQAAAALDRNGLSHEKLFLIGIDKSTRQEFYGVMPGIFLDGEGNRLDSYHPFVAMMRGSLVNHLKAKPPGSLTDKIKKLIEKYA